MVYVLSKSGEPLMPTNNHGKIRILLKQNKAKIVDYKPFTIQLLYETPSYTQPIIIGIDTGRDYISIIAILASDGTILFSSQLKIRNREIPKLMLARKLNRQQRCQNRRHRKIRVAKRNGTTYNRTKHKIMPGTNLPIPVKYIINKPSRFSNRKRPIGWLTPTARHLLDTHLNYITKITNLLPVTKQVIEYARFDIHRLKNPTIRGIGYQRGDLYGYNNLREYVYARQSGKCLLCNKEKIKELHHIEPRSDNGSDTPSNAAGLCSNCHTNVQNHLSYDKLLRTKLKGLKKEYTSTSLLNTIMPFLYKELCYRYSQVFLTYGYITSTTRQIYKLPKTHIMDSYLIALQESKNPNYANIQPFEPYQYHQFRRHTRHICDAIRDRYYKLNGKTVAYNRHKRMNQKRPSLVPYRSKTAIKNKLPTSQLTN